MMDCKAFALLLDKAPEALTPGEREEMRLHMETCADCALEFALRQDLGALDAGEQASDSFGAGWRRAIRGEDENAMRSGKKFGWARYLAAAAAAVFVIGGAIIAQDSGWGLNGFTGSSVPQTKNSAYTADDSENSGVSGGMLRSAVYEGAPAEGANYDAAAGALSDAQRAEKIIRTVDMTIKTQRYEADYQALRDLVSAHGGRVESLSLSGDASAGTLRRAYLTLRIPSAQLDAFTQGAANVGAVSSYSEQSEDVSESYYDIQTRLDTQKAKLARLNELLLKAQDVEDLITIESAISDTQYQIDAYTGQMNGMDSRVNESYVNVTVRELSPSDAAEVKALTLGERALNALKASVQGAGVFLTGLAVFLAAALPWLAGAGLIAFIVVLIVRRRKK